MTGADVEANGETMPPDPVVTGFQIMELTDRDELGLRYRAREQSTGLLRTVRVVASPLTPDQRDDLRDLWGRLLHHSFDVCLATVVAHATTADDAPWVATDDDMDESLASQLATGKHPTALEVERIAAHGARALRVLHGNGFVHGGVGPGAMVRAGESWRLTDVGINAITSQVRRGGADAVLGEVTAHAAPEVLAGAPHTPAADIYAFGATIAEALTGRPLMRWEPGDTADVLLRRRLTEPPALPHDVEPTVLLRLVRAACETDPERRPTASALLELLGTSTVGLAPADAAPIRVTDDDVQFTVYRPGAVKPGRWYTMIAFAHKTDPADPDFGPPDPLEEVKRQANAVLGDGLEHYVAAVEDSASIVERGSDLTFVPQMEGVEFNPPHSSFKWVEAVRREEFRLRAEPSLDGRRARGRLSVFVGNLLVADVNLAIRVDRTHTEDAPAARLEPQWGRPYRKIFASYSHRDDAIVEHMGTLVKSLGDDFVRDCSDLRAGEVWSDRLEELIGQADIFQLFWSTNSIGSPFVRQEWEYALSLDRPSFVRPCYWEEPLPVRPEENLPPETLQRLHFQHLAFSAGNRSTTAAPSSDANDPPEQSSAVKSPDPGMTAHSPSLSHVQSAPARAGSPQPPSPPKPRRRRAAAAAGVGSLAVVVSLVLGQGILSGGHTEYASSPARRPNQVNLKTPASAPGPAADAPGMLNLDALSGKLSDMHPGDDGVVLDGQAARCGQDDPGACTVVADTLMADCAQGMGSACDALRAVSPPGSDSQRYGATCGFRLTEEAAGRCVDR